MRSVFCCLLSLTVSVFAVACGSESESSENRNIKIEQRDSAAYRIGYEHARQLLERCYTTDEIRVELLDIRARETLIRTRLRPSAADAYIQGVRHAICNSGDTLAVVLFGGR